MHYDILNMAKFILKCKHHQHMIPGIVVTKSWCTHETGLPNCYWDIIVQSLMLQVKVHISQELDLNHIHKVAIISDKTHGTTKIATTLHKIHHQF